MRILMRFAISILSLASILGPATPASAANCQFVLGFKAIHDAMPATVGNCLVNEHHDAVTGDALQETTGPSGAGGLLVWRKADNWTAYTDGFRTWVNGPAGLQQRLNTERFTWEGDYAMVYALTLKDLPSGFVVDPTSTGAVTNDSIVKTSSDAATTQSLLQKWERTGGYEADYIRAGAQAAPGMLVVVNWISLHRSPQGAQAELVNPPGVGWQPVSAPTVGDQSVAYIKTQTVTIQSQSVDLTSYEIEFRVGSVLAAISTGGTAASADINQAVGLAQIVAQRIRSHG